MGRCVTQTVDVFKSIDDFLDQHSEAKACVEQFVLWPHRWRTYTKQHGSTSFEWSSFAFIDKEVENIPEAPGVYTISIEPGIADHPGASFLMYVGKTEKQTLRTRFRQYLREKGDPKGRGHIVALLNKYEGYLVFHCTGVPDGMSEDEAEKALQAGFIPPSCRQLPAEVQKIVRAF